MNILRKNFLSLLIVQMANYVVPFVALPYLTRVLGVESYGLSEWAISIGGYASILVAYGFDFTATRKMIQDQLTGHALNKLYSTVLFIRLFFTASTILVILPIIWAMDAHLVWLVLAGMMVTVGNSFFPTWIFQGFQELSKLAWFTMVGKIIYIISLFSLVHDQDDLVLATALYGTTHLIASLLALVYLFSKKKIRIVTVSKSIVVEQFREGATVFWSGLFTNTYSIFSIVLLGFLSTSEELSIFASGNKIVYALQSLVLMPFAQTMFPHVTGLVKSNIEQYWALIKKLIIYISAAMLVAGIGILLVSSWLPVLIFGPEFKQSENILRILSFLPLFAALTNVISYQGLIAMGQEKRFMYINLGAGLMSVVLAFLVFPTYGATGAAWVRLASETLVTSLSAYTLYQLYVNRSVLK